MSNIEKIQPSHIFTNYIFKAIPLAFDESMSYYETLCGVLDLLHTHTEVINNNADVVAELESYVEHYFDNLDVQEEINNKLDEMVTDGTLDEIINQEIFTDLNNQVTQNKNDIEALQTLTTNLPTDETNIQKLQKFNLYTNQPLKYGKLNLPSDFDHYNFELYRNYDGTIYDNLDLSSYDTVNKLYVDRDNGDDTNDGAEATPLKTIKGALTKISSLTGNNWKVICKTYHFYRNEFYNETQANEQYDMYKNIIIEPYDMTKQILVTVAQETLVWTSDGNGVYHATRSSIYNVYDMSEKDVFGCYKMVTKVNTLTDCQNTVNSYYISGSTIYMHTKTGSQPTNDTYIINLSLSTCTFNIRNNLYLYLKNIDFYVASPLRFSNLSSSYENTLICENVKIFGAGAENGFTINNIKNCYILNCTTGYNLRDGFNYHFTTMPTETIANTIIYEKNCKSYNNGLNDNNYTNNCSTIHEGANIIRVNNVYQNSRGPIVADINSSKSLLINCKITQELTGSSYYNQFAFQDDTEGVGKAYLIDCSSIGTTTLSITGTNNFNVQLKNFHGNYENPDLNITLYNE